MDVINRFEYPFVKPDPERKRKRFTAVIHGGSANGLTAWKNKDGKTLKKLESG